MRRGGGRDGHTVGESATHSVQHRVCGCPGAAGDAVRGCASERKVRRRKHGSETDLEMAAVDGVEEGCIADEIKFVKTRTHLEKPSHHVDMPTPAAPQTPVDNSMGQQCHSRHHGHNPIFKVEPGPCEPNRCAHTWSTTHMHACTHRHHHTRDPIGLAHSLTPRTRREQGSARGGGGHAPACVVDCFATAKRIGVTLKQRAAGVHQRLDRRHFTVETCQEEGIAA